MAATRKPPAGKADDAPQVMAYTVISPLSHDQVWYAVGEEIELTDSQAAPLLGHTITTALAKNDNTSSELS